MNCSIQNEIFTKITKYLHWSSFQESVFSISSLHGGLSFRVSRSTSLTAPRFEYFKGCPRLEITNVRALNAHFQYHCKCLLLFSEWARFYSPKKIYHQNRDGFQVGTTKIRPSDFTSIFSGTVILTILKILQLISGDVNE